MTARAPRRRALWALLALPVIALALTGCGGCGGDDDSGGETAASTPADTAAPKAGDGSAAKQGGGQRPAQKDGAKDGGKSKSEDGGQHPDSLDTDPDGISGAIVTETGAVQTLPPSEGAHQTAQKNSYTSIKSFGEEIEGEEATNITFALVQFLTAKAKGDWATACARIYGPLRVNLERGNRSCAETFGALMERSAPSTRAEQAKIDVSSIRRGEGNRAFVIYKTPDTLSADMPMYVEGGVWRVGAIEAYVLTPGQVG